MAWEWLAPVGALVGSTVGSSGTLWVASRNRKETVTASHREHEHALALAREERQQERIANAYVELLKFSERLGQWTQAIWPSPDRREPLESIAAMPVGDSYADISAISRAFASEGVLSHVGQFLETVENVRKSGVEMEYLLDRRSKGEQVTAELSQEWSRLDSILRPAAQNARLALGERINDELRGN